MREVGIIIPSYRREKELFQLLKSLNKLNYSKKKLIIYIVIDGFKILNKNILKVSKFKTVTLFNERNMGPSFSRNKALRRSKTKYIWFLDSDALILKKNTLNKMIEYLNKYNIDGVTGYAEKFNSVYKVHTSNFYNNLINLEMFTNLKEFRTKINNFFSQTSLFVDKQKFVKKFGWYDNKLRIKEDEELVNRVNKKFRNFLIKKDTLVRHCPNLIAKNTVIQHIFNVIKTRQDVVKKNKRNPILFIWYDTLMVLDFLFKRIFHGKNFTSRRVSLMKKDFNLSEVVKSAVALFKFYLGIKIIS
jgi:glycosyltransferase involved in cell wall biosynthesis